MNYRIVFIIIRQNRQIIITSENKKNAVTYQHKNNFIVLFLSYQIIFKTKTQICRLFFWLNFVNLVIICRKIILGNIRSYAVILSMCFRKCLLGGCSTAEAVIQNYIRVFIRCVVFSWPIIFLSSTVSLD